MLRRALPGAGTFTIWHYGAACARARQLLLGPGDQIVIRAANMPDVSEKPIRIDLNGNINMPMIGRIQAGGMTVGQLEEEIARRLKVYLEEPDVAVSITEYQSQPVSVFGEVANPGVHQLQGGKRWWRFWP